MACLDAAWKAELGKPEASAGPAPASSAGPGVPDARVPSTFSPLPVSSSSSSSSSSTTAAAFPPPPATTASNAAAAGTRCAVCGAVSLKSCSQCTQARYCSVDCQRKDWLSGHKKTCLSDKPKQPLKKRGFVGMFGSTPCGGAAEARATRTPGSAAPKASDAVALVALVPPPVPVEEEAMDGEWCRPNPKGEGFLGSPWGRSLPGAMAARPASLKHPPLRLPSSSCSPYPPPQSDEATQVAALPLRDLPRLRRHLSVIACTARMRVSRARGGRLPRVL